MIGSALHTVMFNRNSIRLMPLRSGLNVGHNVGQLSVCESFRKLSSLQELLAFCMF